MMVRGIALVAVGLAASACVRPSSETTDTARADTSMVAAKPAAGDPVRDTVVARARAVLGALSRRDGPALAALAHPARGVRFSAYSFVRPDSDVVVPRDSVARLFSDSSRRVWGTSDGSGDPILLTFPEYFARFVYDKPFLDAPAWSYNGPPIRPSNLPSNLAAVYPRGRWVEFHFKGFEAKYDGMDWRSLWLVFEPAGGDWLLVGVVHGSWTI